MNTKDSLGDRIKEFYENRTRFYLPRRTYCIIRLDMKSGHSYTRGLKKPFDQDLIQDLDESVQAFLPEIQGAQFAYLQSDEISILLTDFANPNTDAWFDGNIQKIASVSASLMTAQFNFRRSLRGKEKLAYFDARVFSIPDRIEVINYFIWRGNDCERNSISSVAQAHFSHKALLTKSNQEKQEMLYRDKGINWSKMEERLKNGRIISRKQIEVPDAYSGKGFVMRSKWEVEPAWKFTQDVDRLKNLVPIYP